MFAIALVLLAVAVGLIWVAIASHKATHPGLVYSVRALAVLVAAIAILTWPFYVGRWIFNIECQHFAGYSVESPVDARSEGFFDERLFQQRELYGVSANNFWDDIDVLGNGAVAFFEVHRRTTAWHHGEYGVAADHVRYFLADEGAKECVPQSKEFGLRAKMMALAPGKCLAAERAEPLRSRFVITASGYHHTDSSATTKITDKRSGKTVGTFKSYNHFNPLNFVSGRDAVCPQYADRSFSPHRTLASMVFMDRNGKTKHLE